MEVIVILKLLLSNRAFPVSGDYCMEVTVEPEPFLWRLEMDKG